MKLIPLHSERGDELFRVTCICRFARKPRPSPAIGNAYDTYYHRKENQAYEEENDSIVAASSLVVPARRVWQG